MATHPVSYTHLDVYKRQLLKNAHEAGGEAAPVSMRLTQLPGWLRIEVLDRGTGMNDSVLQNALVPFYSTKPVSYTHLDVYKRQHYMYQIWL